MRAVRSLPDFRWQSSLRTWLCGLVVNCCRERFREPMFDELAEAGEAHHPDAVLPDPGGRIDVEAALERLAPGYRSIVVLHDVYGHTHKEIGVMLAIDEGTSKSQLSRARRLLRAHLEPLSDQRTFP